MSTNKLESNIRKANIADLPSIIQLLADDPLGQVREDSTMPPNQNYVDAITNIIHDDNAELLVIESNENVIGVAQINYLHYLTYQGGLRAQIEGVRIHKKYQGKGLGKQLFQYLISRAKNKNCHLVQLTTDKSRPDALKFYENLGFVQSHIGMKLHFEENTKIENDPDQ